MMMPRLRVDKGAIKFVFQGANIMCPGLTSKGATIHDEVDLDTPVARTPTPLPSPSPTSRRLAPRQPLVLALSRGRRRRRKPL